MKKKTKRAWVIQTSFKEIIGRPQIEVYEEKLLAEWHCKYWNDMIGHKDYKVVPCTITY